MIYLFCFFICAETENRKQKTKQNQLNLVVCRSCRRRTPTSIFGETNALSFFVLRHKNKPIGQCKLAHTTHICTRKQTNGQTITIRIMQHTTNHTPFLPAFDVGSPCAASHSCTQVLLHLLTWHLASALFVATHVLVTSTTQEREK